MSQQLCCSCRLKFPKVQALYSTVSSRLHEAGQKLSWNVKIVADPTNFLIRFSQDCCTIVRPDFVDLMILNSSLKFLKMPIVRCRYLLWYSIHCLAIANQTGTKTVCPYHPHLQRTRMVPPGPSRQRCESGKRPG